MPLRKRRLFEFEDLGWFPDFIRRSMLDYLEFIFARSDLYAPAAPLLLSCIEKTNSTSVLDTCSGGGGPMLGIEKHIHEAFPGIEITLSDRFPNIAAFESIKKHSGGKIGYSVRPVDACDVPTDMAGLRTCFSALHHFDPEDVREMLLNAVKARHPIAIFDGAGNKWLLILGIVFVHPLILFFCTPFLRPFRWSRLIFTYLIPLIPLCIIWDGVVSIINLYSVTELEQLVTSLGDTDYQWSTGSLAPTMGVGVSYLTGYPRTPE